MPRHPTRGFVMVTMVISTTALLGCIGLAIDAGYLQLVKTRMQTAADAAAMGGVQDFRLNGGANITGSALADAANNGFADGLNDVTVAVHHPPSSGYSIGDPMAVEVIISKTAGTFFLRALGLTSAIVNARSVARLPTSGTCLVALDPAASSAFSLSGGVDVTTTCGVGVDSTSPTALDLTGGSILGAPYIHVAGGYVVSGGSQVSPAPVTHVAPETDPLFYMQPPAVGACDFTDYKLNGKSEALSPGVYCGGIALGGGANATLNPGTYILLGGGLSINGGAQASGTGVTFYNTHNALHAYAGISINGGGTVQLTAPVQGSLAGMLFFQDRTVSGGGASSFNGGAALSFTGTLYFPTTNVSYSGGATGAYTALVAKELSFSGGATFNSNYSSLPGGSPLRGSAILSE